MLPAAPRLGAAGGGGGALGRGGGRGAGGGVQIAGRFLPGSGGRLSLGA